MYVLLSNTCIVIRSSYRRASPIAIIRTFRATRAFRFFFLSLYTCLTYIDTSVRVYLVEKLRGCNPRRTHRDISRSDIALYSLPRGRRRCVSVFILQRDIFIFPGIIYPCLARARGVNAKFRLPLIKIGHSRLLIGASGRVRAYMCARLMIRISV